MSELPTLETDAETMRDEYDHADSDFGPFAPSDTVPADFARRLERERDEAREKCASWIREWRGLRDFCRQLDEDANDRLRERDEAREALKAISSWEGGLGAKWPQEIAQDFLSSCEMEAAK